jgi:porin
MGGQEAQIRWCGTAVGLWLLLVAPCAVADSAASGPRSPTIAASLPPSLADPGGLRDLLVPQGVTYQLNYIGEALANASGGMRRGVVYDGRVEVALDLDLQRLAGWSGATAHVNAFQIHGNALSRGFIGNLAPVSSIEATPGVRLHEAWLEQELLAELLAVRLGQLAADTEFLTSAHAGLFMNNTFGWPTIASANLPSGGPAYPFSTPGLRVRLAPTRSQALLIALLNGDPAGPGADDPQERNRHGLNFRVSDRPLIIGEAQLSYGQQHSSRASPGAIKLGAWYHFGRFADQRFGTDGLPLGDPLGSQTPVQRTGNYGIYAVIDQQIHLPVGAATGVGAFLRVATSPGDRNLIDAYVDSGLAVSGMIAARPDDAIGIAAAYARISGAARGFDRDQVFLAGEAIPVRDYEALIEVTYQAQVVPGWTVQPSIQYVVHPGGRIANPLEPTDPRPIRDALFVGVRTTIRY